MTLKRALSLPCLPSDKRKPATSRYFASGCLVLSAIITPAVGAVGCLTAFDLEESCDEHPAANIESRRAGGIGNKRFISAMVHRPDPLHTRSPRFELRRQ